MKDEIKGSKSWMRKEDIIAFYKDSFDFAPNEIHFSINDIIMNLDNIPEKKTLEVEVKLNTEECAKVAEAILDDYKYQGRSIREWIEVITS